LLQHYYTTAFIPSAIYIRVQIALLLFWGFLQDILQNESIKLDWEFKISLISDIAEVAYAMYLKTVYQSKEVKTGT